MLRCLALLVLFFGLAAQGLAAPPGRQMSPLGGLPASFDGVLQAAEGARRWQLDILPGGTYQLRQSAAKLAPVDGIGRYTLEGRRLTLLNAEVSFDLKDDGSLARVSPPRARLQRLSAPALIEPRLALDGLFTYFADAPRMVLCADGRSMPVEQSADYPALERAYSATGPATGAPLWVQVEALIAPRPAMEASQPPQPTVVVVRFQRLDAQGRCDDNKADRPLLGTDWRLPGARPGSPATLRFDGGRVTGSDGCNRVMGPVLVAGSQLRFGPLAGTRMACSSGQAEADAFGAALLRVQRHRIRGDVLELQDEEGTALLRLQATP